MYSHLPKESHGIKFCDMESFLMTSQPSGRALHPSRPPGFPKYTLNSSQAAEQLCCTRYSFSKNNLNAHLTPGRFLAMTVLGFLRREGGHAHPTFCPFYGLSSLTLALYSPAMLTSPCHGQISYNFITG